MKSVHFLSAEELAAVAHPLRQRILGLLTERGELSGREISESIPGAPSNPYYHLGLLRKAGLIELVRTVRRRGATEKYFGPVARTFSLDPGELAGAGAAEGVGVGVRTGIMAVARNGAEASLSDLAEAIESGAAGGEGEDPFINMCTLRLPVRLAEQLRARMNAWLADAVEAGTARPDRNGDAGEDRCVEYVFYQLFFPKVGA